MQRLIDANALMVTVEKDFEGVCVYDVPPSEAVSDFERIIDSMPTIDAVPVVRCKDCEMCVDTKYGLVCDHTDRNVPADGFCHAGKRKVLKNEND